MQPLRGGGDPTTSVEQRHLLLPPARLHLGTRVGSHSPLMPSLGGAALGNRLTPTAANGRFTAVRFSGLNDSTLDELYPLMGGSLSGRQHVFGAGGDQSPLPLPHDIDADDWNFVRSEVGRLKHAALVEIIMHCLGGAVDVHDALNGMGQGGGDGT
ncbi:Hypothetical protein, putative [Bodo saltans]|uniref:Uncharacterized protein n=1 Tax=Bodo saltans TaxID=75058 RepID=A0A0S4ILF2_BODSA|nr:Hypothetical protein, putative [Bodo saltans]|eukprot:CUE71165.1 Hypothetical protein, putative [Bodo saltans]